MPVRRLLPVIIAVLLAASVLPTEAAPCGFGCFVERARLAAPEKWDVYCRHMASLGMNTFAFYPVSDADLIYQMDTAVEVGMLQQDVPVILVSNMKAAPGVVGNDAEWSDLPRRVAEARGAATHGDQWPQVLIYGTDEPAKAEQCISWSCSYRAKGAKAITAICTPNVVDFLPYLDAILIHASPGVLTAENVAATHEQGTLFGVYNIGLSRKGSPALARYWTGQWTWQAGCKLNLLWCYADLIEDGPEGPKGKPICEGYAAGVRDYHLLRQLDALRSQTPDWDFWPGMTGSLGPEVAAKWKADWISYAAECAVSNPAADAIDARAR